jgi:hypothetical protein
MTDDQQLRSLLRLAAELPDDVQPPVGPLLRRARRTRRVRAVCSVLAVVAVTGAAFALPSAIRGLSRGSRGPTTSGHGKRGPTAAQLAHFRWSSLPPSPLGSRSQPLLTWTGKELIELGGIKNHMQQLDGAAFVPATGRWHRIAPTPYNVGFTSGWTGRNYSNVVDAWTGRELFVTNGDFESCAGPGGVPAMCWPHAGLYDPSTNTWSSTKLPKQMYGLDLQSAVWTGRDVLIAGTAHNGLKVAAYNPATDLWRMITPQLPARHYPSAVAMVATRDRVLLWSLWTGARSVTVQGPASSGMDVLALDRSGRWSTITGAWPQQRTVSSPVYANGTILIPPGSIWCDGRCIINTVGGFPAELANAATLAVRAVPDGPLVRHPGMQPSIWLWNGRAAVAATVQASRSASGHVQSLRIARMAAFDPRANRWTVLRVPPGQLPKAANPLWAGRELLLLTAAGTLLSFHS